LQRSQETILTDDSADSSRTGPMVISLAFSFIYQSQYVIISNPNFLNINTYSNSTGYWSQHITICEAAIIHYESCWLFWTMIAHVSEGFLCKIPWKTFMLIPNTIHWQIRAFTIIWCSFQRAINHVIRRIFVRDIQFRGHYYWPPLLSEIFCTTQNAAEIIRGAVNGVIHHHLPAVREIRHYLHGEVNMMSVNIFRLQRSFVLKIRQRYEKYLTRWYTEYY